MKIGLLTYNRTTNYGAVLQCYATCRILKELGHDVEIIDIEQIKYSKLHDLAFYFNLKAFAEFQHKFYSPRTRLFKDTEDLRSEIFDYDYLLVGSDQVWNPAISNVYCMAMFLGFGDEKIKRLSYASSFGIAQWLSKYDGITKEVSDCLHKFKAISIREKTGQQILKEKFGVDSKLVLDPTLLHENYNEIVGDVSENGYVYSHLLNRNKTQLRKALEVSKALGQKPRMISSIYPFVGFKYVYPPSIESWIKRIAGAKLVITDSFHGVVFSIIYRRNFIVITPETGITSRIKDLLALAGIEGHFFYDNEDIPYEKVINDRIDYDKVHSILSEYRKDSIDFLKSNIV